MQMHVCWKISCKNECLLQNKLFHHAADPSTATVVVHNENDGDVTDDYLLSQQLQDKG